MNCEMHAPDPNQARRGPLCPICGGDTAPARPVHRRRLDALMRCGACGSLFAHPRPSREQLDELYRQEYYDAPAGTADVEKRGWAYQRGAQLLHRTVLRAIARRHGGVVGPGRRVLDFGCGLGSFLAEARAAGMEAVGVEMSPLAADHARDNLGLDVRTGDEGALDELPDGSFNLVTAWAVLEHTLHPRNVVARLAAKLASGGVLGLTLPNLGCWRYRLVGGRWFNIQDPTHLNFPTCGASRRMLENAGLAHVERVVYWGGRTGFGPLASALQYLIRLANLGSEFRLLACR